MYYLTEEPVIKNPDEKDLEDETIEESEELDEETEHFIWFQLFNKRD